MNSISLTGNLGKDAEIRYLPDSTPIASFSVADSQGRDKPTIWWNCSLFGKRADALAPHLIKGQQVTVIGSLTEREWVDKDGQKRKSMDVRVNDIALQGGRKDDSQALPAQKPVARQQPRPASGFDDLDDGSDIPF